MKKFSMTLSEVESHQRKHGFIPGIQRPESAASLTLYEARPRMNKTETEFSYILEAQKRRGEIQRYLFQGMTLTWGVDPETGKPMRYTPDFVVFVHPRDELSPIKMIEVKGPHIHYRQQALARFKGCRSDWPEFKFELWQKAEGRWTQIL